MAAAEGKGPMQDPRSTEEVMKSAAAVVGKGKTPDTGSEAPSEAAPTDSATKPIITDQEDA